MQVLLLRTFEERISAEGIDALSILSSGINLFFEIELSLQVPLASLAHSKLIVLAVFLSTFKSLLLIVRLDFVFHLNRLNPIGMDYLVRSEGGRD